MFIKSLLCLLALLLYSRQTILLTQPALTPFPNN